MSDDVLIQPPRYWGTSVELDGQRRNDLNQQQAGEALIGISKRIFGDRFDYSQVVFRSLNHSIILTDRTTGETFKVTPYKHLLSEDGHGTSL